MKYITAVVTAQRDQANAAHDRMQEGSSLLKNVLLIPFNMGIPLLRQIFGGSKRRA